MLPRADRRLRDRRSWIAAEERGQALPVVGAGRRTQVRPKRRPGPGHVAVLGLDRRRSCFEGRRSKGRIQPVDLVGRSSQIPSVPAQL
jgi:hypothetical protein